MKLFQMLSDRKKRRAVLSVLSSLVCIGILVWAYFQLTVIDRILAPDGTTEIVVRNLRVFHHTSYNFEVVTRHSGSPTETERYQGSFIGLYWAPDSSRYVLLESSAWSSETDIHVCDLNGRGYSLMNLESEVGAAERTQGRAFSRPKAVTYGFVQWSEDSCQAELSYFFTDENATPFTGTFWYDFELHRPDKDVPDWLLHLAQ